MQNSIWDASTICNLAGEYEKRTKQLRARSVEGKKQKLSRSVGQSFQSEERHRKYEQLQQEGETCLELLAEIAGKKDLLLNQVHCPNVSNGEYGWSKNQDVASQSVCLYSMPDGKTENSVNVLPQTRSKNKKVQVRLSKTHRRSQTLNITTTSRSASPTIINELLTPKFPPLSQEDSDLPNNQREEGEIVDLDSTVKPSPQTVLHFQHPLLTLQHSHDTFPTIREEPEEKTPPLAEDPSSLSPQPNVNKPRSVCVYERWQRASVKCADLKSADAIEFFFVPINVLIPRKTLASVKPENVSHPEKKIEDQTIKNKTKRRVEEFTTLQPSWGYRGQAKTIVADCETFYVFLIHDYEEAKILPKNKSNFTKIRDGRQETGKNGEGAELKLDKNAVMGRPREEKPVLLKFDGFARVEPMSNTERCESIDEVERGRKESEANLREPKPKNSSHEDEISCKNLPKISIDVTANPHEIPVCDSRLFNATNSSNVFSSASENAVIGLSEENAIYDSSDSSHVGFSNRTNTVTDDNAFRVTGLRGNVESGVNHNAQELSSLENKQYSANLNYDVYDVSTDDVVRAYATATSNSFPFRLLNRTRDESQKGSRYALRQNDGRVMLTEETVLSTSVVSDSTEDLNGTSVEKNYIFYPFPVVKLLSEEPMHESQDFLVDSVSAFQSQTNSTDTTESVIGKSQGREKSDEKKRKEKRRGRELHRVSFSDNLDCSFNSASSGSKLQRSLEKIKSKLRIKAEKKKSNLSKTSPNENSSCNNQDGPTGFSDASASSTKEMSPIGLSKDPSFIENIKSATSITKSGSGSFTWNLPQIPTPVLEDVEKVAEAPSLQNTRIESPKEETSVPLRSILKSSASSSNTFSELDHLSRAQFTEGTLEKNINEAVDVEENTSQKQQPTNQDQGGSEDTLRVQPVAQETPSKVQDAIPAPEKPEEMAQGPPAENEEPLGAPESNSTEEKPQHLVTELVKPEEESLNVSQSTVLEPHLTEPRSQSVVPELEAKSLEDASLSHREQLTASEVTSTVLPSSAEQKASSLIEIDDRAGRDEETMTTAINEDAGVKSKNEAPTAKGEFDDDDDDEEEEEEENQDDAADVEGSSLTCSVGEATRHFKRLAVHLSSATTKSERHERAMSIISKLLAKERREKRRESAARREREKRRERKSCLRKLVNAVEVETEEEEEAKRYIRDLLRREQSGTIENSLEDEGFSWSSSPKATVEIDVAKIKTEEDAQTTVACGEEHQRLTAANDGTFDETFGVATDEYRPSERPTEERLRSTIGGDAETGVSPGFDSTPLGDWRSYIGVSLLDTWNWRTVPNRSYIQKTVDIQEIQE